MRLGNAVVASAATGLSLAMVFYFAGIGQNVVKKAANWVITQSTDVVN